MTENDRLKIIRTELKLTQRAFSEALEIKQGSYSDVERGKAGISALLLKNLIRKFHINPIWLCEGDGDIFLQEGGSWYTPSKPNSKGKDNKLGQEDDECQLLLQREQLYINSIQEVLEFLSR